MRAWSLLILAILAEVCGTSAMKFASTTEPLAGYLLMYIMISISYYLLSLAVKHVPVGIAYALWEGIGIVLITAVSYFYFDEGISLTKMTGLLCILGGILLLKAGSHSQTKTNGSHHAAS